MSDFQLAKKMTLRGKYSIILFFGPYLNFSFIFVCEVLWQYAK